MSKKFTILSCHFSFCLRVRTLGIAFRYWASITKLDRQAEGTLSPHTFAILLIYFLQQIPQVRFSNISLILMATYLS
jgi:DNA polymerase sigma